MWASGAPARQGGRGAGGWGRRGAGGRGGGPGAPRGGGARGGPREAASPGGRARAAQAARGRGRAPGRGGPRPLWIDYGEGSVPPEVRAVFARPGVVVTASGTALPKDYRAKGAATTYFVLSLPGLVGDPTKPADPASIQATADALYDRAVASTA